MKIKQVRVSKTAEVDTDIGVFRVTQHGSVDVWDSQTGNWQSTMLNDDFQLDDETRTEVMNIGLDWTYGGMK